MNTKTKLLLLSIFPLVLSLLFTAQNQIKEALANPIQPKIALTSSNTPSEADYVVHWYSENIYCTHRYTEFHYRYVQRVANAHVDRKSVV